MQTEPPKPATETSPDTGEATSVPATPPPQGRGRRRSPAPPEAAVEGPLVQVGPSPIHGKGLFAVRSIAKGTRIGTLEGVPARRNGPHVLWYTDEQGQEVGLRGTNDLRFVNHAGRANAAFRGPELWALRRIAAGEEITHDYGPNWPRSTPEPVAEAPADAPVAAKKKRKTRAELRTEKCRRCGARCCKSISLYLSTPTTRRDYDVLRWYLHHQAVNVFLNHSGDWMLEFLTPCEQLTADGQCGCYETRPDICRTYPTRRQYCEFERDPYSRKFETVAELDAYLAENT